MHELKQILTALLLTEIFELSMSFTLQLRGLKNYLWIALINLITNVPLNIIMIIFSKYINDSIMIRWILVGVLEVLIVFIESFLIRKTIKHKLHPMLYSLIINTVSFVSGILVYVIPGKLI